MSKSRLPPPEDRFHANVVKMTDLIKKVVISANKSGYNGVTTIMIDLAANYIRSNYDKTALIENFIIHSHKTGVTMWDKILERDEAFFEEKAFDIFQGLPSNYIETFKNLYNYKDPNTGKSIIDEKDKEEIMDYFQSFVRICINYIHSKRLPYTKQEDGKPKYFYRNASYMKDVNVLAHAKKWKLLLEFPQK